MTTDPLFFELFKELPSCFFCLIGRDEADARRYEMDAVELKSSSVRLDGIFRPRDSDAGPAYLWESQLYASNKAYANLLTKIGRFLEHGDPAQNFVAVVIYPTRQIEQKNLEPYQFLLQSNQLVRIYLDELPRAPSDRIDLGILELIASKPDATLEKAKAMVKRLHATKHPKQVKHAMLQFIETVVVHQFPNWTRAEIAKMLQVTDMRQTRVYQEGIEDGREEGRKEGRDEALTTVVRRMIEAGKSTAEIVEATGLKKSEIRKYR